MSHLKFDQSNLLIEATNITTQPRCLDISVQCLKEQDRDRERQQEGRWIGYPGDYRQGVGRARALDDAAAF